MTASRRRQLLVTATLLFLSPVSLACGTGQVAQTAEQVSYRTEARVGEIAVLDVAFLFRFPVVGDEVYGVGDTAPLSVTIANHGAIPDRLVGLSSPIATTAVVVAEDLWIPDRTSLTAGQEGPVASIEAADENDIGLIALAGLREPIRSGLTYPVVFEFERAGEVLVRVPVDTPDIPYRVPSIPSS